MYQNLPNKVGFGPKSYSLISTEYNEGIVVSGESIDTESIIDKIKKISSSNIIHITIGKERNDLDYIDSLSTKYRNDSIDFMVAIGGGSIIDFTKLFRESLSKKSHHLPSFFVIPSLIGSGAESSMTAILNTSRKKEIKVDENFLPNGIIYDLNILKKLPNEKLIPGHLDAISHCIESLTSFNKNLFSEFLALSSLQQFINHCYSGSFSFEEASRSDLAQLALLSFNGGICQNNSGAGLTHALAHSLESLFGKEHALCIAFFLPVVLKYIYEIDADFPLKSDSNLNLHLDKNISMLRKNGFFTDMINYLQIESNLDSCLDLASLDPCWRLFYKKVDSLKLKDLLINYL